MKTQMFGLFAGGFGVGFLEKTFGNKIPSLPLVGRKGAVAIVIAIMNPKEKILQDIGKAAAALSGYELAKEGKISGIDGDDGDVFATT